MSDDEILIRISRAIGRFPYHEKPMIGMTYELMGRLASYMINDGLRPTLHGCYIQIVGNCGLWWIVGYMGSAEMESKRCFGNIL